MDTASAPPLPPGPGPPLPPGSGPGTSAGYPPIAELLVREAHAWSALLGLHGGVVHAARRLAATAGSDASAERLSGVDGGTHATEVREQAYCAALTTLVAQCDALATEALRLRGLRRARCTSELEAVAAIVQPHVHEALAVGGTLASNSALSVQTATSELRQAIQATKTQVSQLRALVAVVEEAGSSLRGDLRIGVQPASPAQGELRVFAVDAVLAAVYRHSPDLTEAALARALAELSTESAGTVGGAPGAADEPSVTPARPGRTVSRRMGSDRSGNAR
jgi:hypothetical protein